MSNDNIKIDDIKDQDQPKRLNPQAALDRLKSGNDRYVAGESNIINHHDGRADRVVAQYPFAAVLSCADSRVAPELLFNQAAGDLFVVRLAGNFVNDDGLASLEYAVEFLNTSLIVVMGHTGCGAIDAAIKTIKHDAKLPGALPTLISQIKPAIKQNLLEAVNTGQKTPDVLLNNAIYDNVKNNVQKLKDSEPLLASRCQKGELMVVGAVYDLSTGRVDFI